MTLVEKIKETYSELTNKDFGVLGCIEICDDADGQGAYINKWEYEKPIPSGLKLGK